MSMVNKTSPLDSNYCFFFEKYTDINLNSDVSFIHVVSLLYIFHLSHFYFLLSHGHKFWPKSSILTRFFPYTYALYISSFFSVFCDISRKRNCLLSKNNGYSCRQSNRSRRRSAVVLTHFLSLYIFCTLL